MSVTLNAHQFGRLLDRTACHIADEFIPALHGVRLETDDTFLYAIASDRYTLAVARYRHHGLDGAPFARTLPAHALASLRRRAADQPGGDPVTVTLAETRLRFTAPQGEVGVGVDDGQEFFGWRGVLRGVIEQIHTETGTDGPFPVFDTRLLARWTDIDHYLRLRVTADRQGALLVGEDFLGAQMPLRTRHDGFDTGLADDLDQIRALWDDALAGALAALMPDSLPAARRSSHDAPRTVAETAKGLLRQTLSSTHDLIEEISTSPAAVAAHANAGVTAWMAFRYLEALHHADPKLAARIVAETAEQLDDGAIGEFAHDAATTAGHDPNAWQDEFETKRAKQQSETGKELAAATGEGEQAPAPAGPALAANG
ncbi:hypothetical protein [Streptomyces sp. NPDC088752]|uniref:hypothetical protein n=1 Tax=Streptomyces sp. NPDC088752 TaxID=3154963 RepID=UPI00343C8490